MPVHRAKATFDILQIFSFLTVGFAELKGTL